MHYYIDGYNLMFRVLQNREGNLQTQRQQMIDDLTQKIEFLELDVTFVFDAQYQPCDSSRSFFRNLEILFTAHGETADEAIINEIKSESKPRQQVVVTSDKKLAWFARRCSVKTESVEEFVAWVNKRCHNKLRHQRAEVLAKRAVIKTAPIVELGTKPIPKALPPAQPGSIDYYLAAFDVEDVPEISIVTSDQPPPSKKVIISEMARWLNLFEKRLEDGE